MPELRAASPGGYTNAILLAHGIAAKLLAGLIRAGLATATAERVLAGGRSMQVTRVRVTEAGRRALARTART